MSLYRCLSLLSITVIFMLAHVVPVSFQSGNLRLNQAEAATEKKKSTKKKAVKKKTSKKKHATSKKRGANKAKATKRNSSKKQQIPQNQTNRWAAIVVDAGEGKILYEKNAEAPRHPASLTKMMTLYLLFDALDDKRYSLAKLLDVSSKAAGQPPTNISLDAGDRIPVRTAIEALVIRSANDVAMVVAENLGGSQEGFAKMMNRKARELGMNDTRFYNPSGLPDDRQITTAADMAKLGIALRRDFPEYYHYFKQTSFSHNGQTYYTHNRVVGRYPGADGIKTGYIRASGFNLVTSVTRGSTRLVGVVMGGASSSSRDQEMINMLDRTFFAMNRKGKGERYVPPAQAEGKPEPETQELEDAADPEKMEQTDPLAESEPKPEEKKKIAAVITETTQAPEIDDDAWANQEPEEAPAFTPQVAAPQEPARKPIRQPTQILTLPSTAQTPPIMATERNWAIQVGAYPNLEQAERAANNAKNIAKIELARSQTHISQVMKDGKAFNRSRLIYLDAEQAKSACERLTAASKVCMVIRMEN